MNKIVLCLFIASLFFCYAQESNGYKQLSASPEELALGHLNLPNPADTGTSSHSAMIPIEFVPVKDSYVFTETLFVDGGRSLALSFISEEAKNWDIKLFRSNGTTLNLNSDANIPELVRSEETTVGMGESQYPAKIFIFEGITSERVRMQITASSSSPSYGIDGFVAYSTRDDYQLYTHLQSHRLVEGKEVGFNAYLFDKANTAEEATPAPLNQLITFAEAHIYLPNGMKIVQQMTDQGFAGDLGAGDGVYGLRLDGLEAGDYTAQIFVEATTPEGYALKRSCQYFFSVVKPTLSINTKSFARVAQTDETGLQIQIPVQVSDANSTAVKAFAEVWGTTTSGTMAPVAWIGGITEVTAFGNTQALPLRLDARWVSRSETRAPFQLRNIRIHDLDKEVPFSVAKEMLIRVKNVPNVPFSKEEVIPEDMLMGPRPGATTSQNTKTGHTRTNQNVASTSNSGTYGYAGVSSSGRLLLVHGYCSGDVWGSQTGVFSGESVFYDLNKNRSHNTFASLIKNFGAQYSSFGIVAHSQGGCASLHLYTYYWSGLDNASSGRLIQSVGTPYKGTSLAGNLAALGNIFGAGCGTNNDLTYDGASNWLSGVPNWSRSKVHYFTTSESDGSWWQWTRCHSATDMFLDDPEDGTTEKSKGQLSGGNNRGHKKGWCHTTSMREPGHTTDYSRNNDMNNNASR